MKCDFQYIHPTDYVNQWNTITSVISNIFLKKNFDDNDDDDDILDCGSWFHLSSSMMIENTKPPEYFSKT